ncbi:MAG: hypothetical protein P4N59_22860 [Negativicutes bacterium]|nr:hypothetical protein [Negativicutes bacterium]
MDKAKLKDYRDLFAKKFKDLWDELSDDIKRAKDVTEIRLQMEFLEAKQDRLFKEYGKAIFLAGDCIDPAVDAIRSEIEALEQELQKKYLELQKLKASS